ncbi:metalloregulator ArsR/SmtB family transcription factor [Sorangium sp. So ce1024]|uniref:metalloregulator ArsR/SmtB family transcription factor n=1 Tax=Sorangium sp. So ce1024 TaxID=3133327 RepID=UPI003F03ADB2
MPDLSTTTELLRLLGDPTRVRLLALLGREELTVAEITDVTQLAQSRVSTHLGKLREAGLVKDRRDGASSFYTLSRGAMPEEARRVWAVLEATTEDPLIEQDRERVREVVRARAGGASWADSVAGRMERHYSPGRTWEASLRGLLGLMSLGDVLDVASGDGALAELVAPRCRTMTCLDASETVVEAARRRLDRLGNVRFARGDMHELPFEAASFDQVMLMNCLTFARSPARALAEAARVLRPGGALAGVTLKTHRHEIAAVTYSHVRFGFEPRELEAMLEAAGLAVDACDVTSREKRPPHFEVISIHARKPRAESAKGADSREGQAAARRSTPASDVGDHDPRAAQPADLNGGSTAAAPTVKKPRRTAEP